MERAEKMDPATAGRADVKNAYTDLQKGYDPKATLWKKIWGNGSFFFGNSGPQKMYKSFFAAEPYIVTFVTFIITLGILLGYGLSGDINTVETMNTVFGFWIGCATYIAIGSLMGAYSTRRNL